MPGPSRRFPRKIVPAFFAALVGCVALFSAQTLLQELQELRRAFEQPPDDSRPMMRWWWFGPAVTDAGLEREMRTMKEGGIGAFEVQPVYPLASPRLRSGY